ncbi:hypothetical protein V5O48_014420, partial [Marasmius crinis-equi]
GFEGHSISQSAQFVITRGGFGGVGCSDGGDLGEGFERHTTEKDVLFLIHAVRSYFFIRSTLKLPAFSSLIVP